MKFAAYTEETIWGTGETEAEARTDAEAAIRETESPLDQINALKVAPIDDGLLAALAEAEASGNEIMFDLIDGELCEVEMADG